MKMHLTQTSIGKIEPKDKPFWITDKDCQNLRLYVGSAGKTWYACYRDKEDDKNKSHKLGSTTALTVAQARDLAKDIAGRIVRGENVKKQKPKRGITLGSLLDRYEPSYMLACKVQSAKKTLDMLRSAFRSILDMDVSKITIPIVEKWRIERNELGNKSGTINKRLSSLRAAFSWAVENGLIETNPLENLKRLKERSTVKPRFLSDDERERLIAALHAREERIRSARENHNEWLSARSKESVPSLARGYADYLMPLVLISLNTGVRQDNLFSLAWGDIDFQNGIMTIRAEEIKTSKTLGIPLSEEAFEVLVTWKAQCAHTQAEDLVFPSPKTGKKLDNCDSSWRKLLKEAGIENFRWHDMRHDFASQLAMKGVPLFTIKELMGHKDIKTTLIYADLAANVKKDAVKLLPRNVNGDTAMRTT